MLAGDRVLDPPRKLKSPCLSENGPVSRALKERSRGHLSSPGLPKPNREIHIIEFQAFLNYCYTKKTNYHTYREPAPKTNKQTKKPPDTALVICLSLDTHLDTYPLRSYAA